MAFRKDWKAHAHYKDGRMVVYDFTYPPDVGLWLKELPDWEDIVDINIQYKHRKM